MVISHVRLFMVISHVKLSLLLDCGEIGKFIQYSMTLLLKTFSHYIINRKIASYMDAWKYEILFLVLKMISHSFAALTRVILYSTLEINFVFPRTHVLFSI